ncbi:MAG: PAS domain S-box protein [Sphingobacteriales bacterium]|nr:PAS domain S-box protein [Sphingobacteriales bacterium]
MSVRQRFKKFSFIFSVAVALVGFLVLIGWAGNITVLKSISPQWISMKANAALCFLLAGSTVILVNRERKTPGSEIIASVFSFIIFSTGTVTVLEYIFGFNAGIDELLFKDRQTIFPELTPGRQSVFSAAYFMLFGFCYLPGIKKIMKPSLFQLIHIMSGIFALAAAMSYLFGTYFFIGVSLKFIYVIHSTLAFLLLILAVLFSQPDTGIMKLVSSNTSGGRVIRSTLPLFIFIFIVLGWLRLKGEQAGLYNEELGISIFILAMIIILGYLLFWGAASFTRSEEALMQSEERLIKANKNLELAEQQAGIGNWEYDVGSKFSHWSKEVFRIFDMPPDAKPPSNKEFLELIHPDDRPPFIEFLNQLLEQKNVKTIIFRTNPKKLRLKYLLPGWQVIKDDKGIPKKYFGTLQDITERVEAKTALKQREELFSKAFHSRVFGLAILNGENQVININDTLAGLLEYKKEELIGKKCSEIELTSPDYLKKRGELGLMLMQKGSIENYELELLTRSGKMLSLLLSVEPLNLGNAPHWLISFVDITEKRKAEKELAESETRLRAILDTVPECVKIIDSNGELTYMNPAGLAMMETDDFEMVKGRKGLGNIHTPYLKEFYRLVTNVFSGTPGKMEYEITGFKGTHRWMETHMVPLRDEEKNIVSLLAVTRDISDRKRSEEEIKKAIERYELIGKATNDAVWEWDLRSNDIWGNDSFYKLYGLNRQTDNLNTLEPYTHTHPDDVLKMKTALDDAFKQQQQSVGFEFRFRMQDNTYRTFLDRVFISYDEKGQPERLIGAMLDITDRKKTEAQIKEYNEQLRQLAANLQTIREDERQRIGREVHDELGQWLAVLKMEIARIKKIKEDEKTLDESIAIMLQQVDGCIQSSKRIATELRPTLIDDMGLIAALEWQAEEFGKRAHIKSAFKTDLDKLKLPIDFAIAIFRIFQESLTNVMRHAEATVVTSSLFIKKGNIVLKIKDNGKGFDTAIIGTKKTMGLIGMRERVLLMNGTYAINSTPDKGTEITVTIPVPTD